MTGTEYKVIGVVTWLAGLALNLFGSDVAPLTGLALMTIGLFLTAVGDILKAIERTRK